MEPQPGAAARAGRGAVRKGMSTEQVEKTVLADVAAVPYVAGANNHMGSLATADASVMAATMRILADRRLYFIDSRTTAATVALDEARRAGVAAFYRSAFLDDQETVNYTLDQLRKFEAMIKEQGVALAIGHPHHTTVAALAKFLPQMERDDVQLVPVSRLVQLPEVAHLSPPRPSP